MTRRPTPSPSGKGGDRKIAVGRRVFLGMVGLGALGVTVGAAVQRRVGSALGSGIGRLLPGGNQFIIYSVTGQYPSISPSAYRLAVTGLVHQPLNLTLDDLESMPSVRMTRTFQCVTGWTVPDVEWEGVLLSDVLDRAGVKSGATAITFESYDGLDTESLTLEQARLPNVIIAYRMLNAPVTREHGGPVRLYVAPMFGYKSLKWLSAIRVVPTQIPGFWEENGYPVNGWLTGETTPTVPKSAA